MVSEEFGQSGTGVAVWGGTNRIVPVDFTGAGKTNIAFWRPSSATWFANRSTAGTLIQQFGTAGDQPIPSAFVPQ